VKIVPDATVLIRAHHRSRALAKRLFHEILERGHRLVLSNEMITEVTRVLRYPHFQDLYGLTDVDLLEYTQLLQSVADIVILDPRYRAPFLRDPNDADVLQTAERGEADLLCTHDGDFYDPAVLSYCATRGIEVCTESTLLERLKKENQRYT
jgi:putative PIN family toxin of toxin-antitoxin system